MPVPMKHFFVKSILVNHLILTYAYLNIILLCFLSRSARDCLSILLQSFLVISTCFHPFLLVSFHFHSFLLFQSVFHSFPHVSTRFNSFSVRFHSSIALVSSILKLSVLVIKLLIKQQKQNKNNEYVTNQENIYL